MAKRMRGLVISRPILIGSTATPLTPAERLTAPPDHTHRWTVAVRSAATEPLATFQADDPDQDANQAIGTRLRDAEVDLHKAVGGKDDLSYFIKRVQFRLHDTYTQPTRTDQDVDRNPFSVTETGWGEFEIQIKIFFVPEAGEKPLTTVHHLKLHPWPSAPVGNTVAPAAASSEAPKPTNPAQENEAGLKVTAPLPPAVHSWQYDEIVFPEPLETFYEILIAHPPTPWPATCAQAFANESDYHAYRQARDAQEKTQPPHPVHTPTGHLFEALALEAQQAEADRIDLARANAVQQLDKKRTKLIETEKLLRDVRAEIRAINPSLAEPAVIT
ncbi:NuA4 histone H4 acetyltransferase complex and the SWR1 complex subunit [Malassezia yamatoensis]|uniref:Protein AF-9 homolog n=1 Tax=Malassezia yamatoensis TaxID=253288 RepID=A0AAJ5YPQ7_9BASI|nr:NuA4 histone H4 acetyltransferase complex and the SWR1 complex subunit [Malassezia yamatoensis]